MTLPNLTNYRVVSTSTPHATCLDLVQKHPLTPLIRQVMQALAQGTLFDVDFALPTKRELTKLIVQSQAPVFASMTPTLLVVLALHVKLLQYVQSLGKRVYDLAQRSSWSQIQSSPLSEDKSEVSDDESYDDGDNAKKIKRSRLTRQSNEYMTSWFLAHKTNPYPTAKERAVIAAATQLSELQVRNWFANMRKRHWKPQHVEKKPRCLLDLVLRRSDS